MKKGTLAALGTFFLPLFAFAQATIADYITTFGGLLNTYVVPLIIALAFVFFLWNAMRYFIIGGASEEGQEKAKRLALWGIFAFVLIVSIWGIVNALVTSFGIDHSGFVCPDYDPGCK